MADSRTPAVSVVMTVYNGAADVPRAVASILAQDFADFEFIAIDDGSPDDDSPAVLARLARQSGDPRMRVVALPRNLGLAAALNHGIGLARGRYIARQDQDDISRPGRLAAQVAFLDANPACGLVGTRAEIWAGDVPTGRHHDHPTGNTELQFALLTNNPFVHSSIMIRRSALDMVGLYSTDRARQPPEDYELWSRLARRWAVANLAERLLVYREVPNSMSRAGPNPFVDRMLAIAAENIAHWAGLAGPDTACRDAAALANAAYDRLSRRASLAAMRTVMARAASGIAAAHGPADLSAVLAASQRNLRHHHRQAHGRGLTGRLRAWLRR